jgi:predicted transcriptional regulator
LLDWSQQQLANAANVGIVTVRHFEAGKVDPRPATLVVIKQALAAAGVEFIEDNGGGEGVRFRKPQTIKKRK